MHISASRAEIGWIGSALAGLIAINGVCAGFVPSPVLAQAADEVYYRLTAESLACVIKHRDVYLASNESPIFIPVRKCPPDGPPSLLDSLTNEVPDLEFAGEDALDGFLSISRDDLECLAGQKIPSGARVVRVFPELCRIENEEIGN